MLANAGKCHLIATFNLPVDICTTDIKISNEGRVRIELLGVNFEVRLNLDYHKKSTLLKKASKKNNALVRVCNYMDIKNNVF